MKKLIAILLCLLLAASLTACAGGGSSSTLALDVDYVLLENQQEEVDEGEIASLFGWLQQQMASDAQGAPSGNETATVVWEDAQDDLEGIAGQSAGSAQPGRRNVLDEDENASGGQSAAPGGGDRPAVDDGSDSQDVGGSGPGEGNSAAPQRNTVTLQIRVDTAVRAEMHLQPRWAGIIPPNGIILPATTFQFQPGDSVYDILRQAGRAHGINISSRGTTLGMYIEGINGLFEFDGGQLSGWMYSVNDWYPNFGVAVYFVQPGDRIEFNYTLDLGRDLGVNMRDW